MGLVPDPNAQHTRELVEELCPGQNCFEDPVEPVEGAAENACIEVVDRLVAERGGERILGWALWEWPGVWIEGEFHAIWKRSDGTLTDPTPKKNKTLRILFVSDPGAQVTTWQKDNVRKARMQRREILDFIDIKERIYRAENQGTEAYFPFTTVTPRLEII